MAETPTVTIACAEQAVIATIGGVAHVWSSGPPYPRITDPIGRAVVVARLRAIADLLEADQ